MPTISPFLWFDTEAEEAARFYVSAFRDGKITAVTHYGPAGPGAEGSVMTVAFELAGQAFTALNAGPRFKFNEAISLAIACEDQAEIDRLWAALTAGGEPGVCGWLKDRYGLSWQIWPKQMLDLLSRDQATTNRVMAAVMTMTKLDLAALEAAAAGA